MAILKVLALVFCVCCVDKSSAIPRDTGSDCSTCVGRISSFVDYIRNEMINGATDDPAQLCLDAPAALRQFCQELVTSLSSEVSMNMDTRYLTRLCRTLNQCRKTRLTGNGNNDMVFDAEMEPSMFDIASDVEGLPCVLCDNFMKLAQMFLKDKKHQTALFRLLKGACRFMPFVKTECEDLVSKYGWLIIHMAAQWVNPELCKMLHICSANLVANENSCKMCEFSVGIIQDSLDDPALRDRLTRVVEQICEDTGANQDTCNDVTSGLSEYLPDVIKSLREKAELANLCLDSGICKERYLEDSLDSDESESEDGDWTPEEAEVY